MNDKRAREYFKIDKPAGKLICKVLMSGDEKNGNAVFCDKEFKNNNNTSVMNGHLLTFHPHIKFKYKNNKTENKETPSSIKTSLLCSSAYNVDSEKYKSITEYLVDFLVETNQPLSLVDQASFIKFVNKLDNKYKLPGRQTITNKYIKEAAQKTKDKITKELEQLEFASMTVDGWSSIANDPYLGIKIYSIT